MSTRHTLTALSLVVLGLSSGTAEAADTLRKAPEWRLGLTSLTVLRYNPLGLEEQLRIGVQKRLYEDEAPAYRDNFVFFGLAPKINPAFVKLGPSIEVQPVSFFNLRIGVEWVRYFGTFGYLQSFESAHDDYSDRRIKALREDTVDGKPNDLKSYGGGGFHFIVEPLLQLKFGPVAFRGKVACEYWSMDLREGDRAFYDPTLDTAGPRTGWVFTLDADVLWVSEFGLLAGVRYSMVAPLYDKRAVRDGESIEIPENTHHRLGPFVGYTFFDRGAVGFNKPTLLLIVNWYMKHRWRTGGDPDVPGGAALPYIVLAFRFESDWL